MELRHLRYFVAVAEELHFRRAAERLHISQPPLSQQIRALEEEIGAPLLIRNRRRVELTAAGQAFLREAREILRAVDGAVELTQRVGRGEVGKLFVGFVGSAMYSQLPDILRSFRSSLPDVDLRLRELPTRTQLDALEDGRIDVGFVRAEGVGHQFASETIQREPVVVALPSNHPLTARKRLRLNELHGEAFVLLTRRESPWMHESLLAAMPEIGEAPVVQEVAEIQTVIGLVAAGLGISLVPASVAALEREGVAYRPLTRPVPVVELTMMWRPTDRSPVLDAFLGVARQLATR